MSIGRRKFGELPVHYDSHPLTCYGLFPLTSIRSRGPSSATNNTEASPANYFRNMMSHFSFLAPRFCDEWDATISTLYLCGHRMGLPEVETG